MCEVQYGGLINTSIGDSNELLFKSVSYVKAFYNLPAPFFIIDVEENVFVEINQSAVDFLGVSASSIIGKRFDKIFVRAAESSEESIPSFPVRGCFNINISGSVFGSAIIYSAVSFSHRGREFCVLGLRSIGDCVESFNNVLNQALDCTGAIAYQRFKSGCMLAERGGDEVPTAVLVLGVEEFFKDLGYAPKKIQDVVFEKLISRINDVFDGVFFNRREPIEFWVRCDSSSESIEEIENSVRSINAPINVEGIVFEPNIRAGVSRQVILGDCGFQSTVADARAALVIAVESNLLCSENTIKGKRGNLPYLDRSIRSDKRGNDLDMLYSPIVSLRDGGVVGYRVMLASSHSHHDSTGPKESLYNEYEELFFHGKAVRLKLLNLMNMLNRRSVQNFTFWVDISIDYLLNGAKFERLLRVFNRNRTANIKYIGLNLLNYESVFSMKKLQSKLMSFKSLGIKISRDVTGFQCRSIDPEIVDHFDAVQLKFSEGTTGADVSSKSALRFRGFAKELSENQIQVLGVNADSEEAVSFLNWIGCDCVSGVWAGEAVYEESLEVEGEKRSSRVMQFYRGSGMDVHT